MPLIRPSLSMFSSGKGLSKFSNSLDLPNFASHLQDLFNTLNLIDQIPTVLKNLTDSLSSYSVPYSVMMGYQPICLSRTTGYLPEEVFSNVGAQDFLVIFDLDETLIHVSENKCHDMVLIVRPMVHHVINLLATCGIKLGVWTAAARPHALNALDIIDPEGKIEYVLYRDPRDHHKYINWSTCKSPEFLNRKALSLLPNGLQTRAILFDNSIASLAHFSSIPRSILVPDFKPTIDVDEDAYRNDSFWLSGLYLIMRVYAKFKACLEHRVDTVDYLFSLSQDGILIDSPQGSNSFLAIRNEYFPKLSEYALRGVLKDIKFVPEGTMPVSEILSCHVSHGSALSSASVSMIDAPQTEQQEEEHSGLRFAFS